MIKLDDFRKIVGDGVISAIYKKASYLFGKHILHINSTYQGGGVAEILSSLVPLMNDTGIDVGWRILHGSSDFFIVTKKFHSALQGKRINFTEMKKKLYLDANREISVYTHIDHDAVIIHDPQPLPLIRFYKKRQPWIWRCHVDLSNPSEEVWEFLKTFILRYDMMIISHEAYRREDLPVEQRVIHPAINPLSPKNQDIPERVILKYLKKFNVPLDKPLISQISRFDQWKDPEGVVEVFKRVRTEVDCRLVLCGSMAADDPEGLMILERVRRKAKRLIEKGDVLIIASENNIFVNALQRRSAVILQKSIREGFGLAVAEALWKGIPVVASHVGGISLQIQDGESGFLVEPQDMDAFADRIIHLIRDPEKAQAMGEKGKAFIQKNFLITRLLLDHLDILSDVINNRIPVR